MARTYAQLIELVRNWSNRDMEVLDDDLVGDCLRYAADKAYRHLRVAPLEHTVNYDDTAMLRAATTSTNNRFASVTELAIPPDLIEFIQIRGVDAAGRTTRLFNEKADVRTFNDLYSEKYSDLAFWTRQGNCILLAPGIGRSGAGYGGAGITQEEAIELYYYRRLPALNATYEVNRDNYLLNLLTDAAGMDFDIDMDLTEPPMGAVGKPVPNWLRDENERVLLMGALAEVFFYLQEDDQAQKYAALFTQEIDELNKEDQMRNSSGGNVQVNFNGRGLI